MKRAVIILCILILLFVGAYLLYNQFGSQPELQISGSRDLDEGFLDFQAEDQAGNAVYFSDFLDRPTIAFFWTTWCSFCKLGIDELVDLYEELGDEMQILLVNLSQMMGNRELILGREFMEASDFPFVSIYDIEGEAERLYAVTGVPMILFFDADGAIYHRQLGYMSADAMLQVMADLE